MTSKVSPQKHTVFQHQVDVDSCMLPKTPCQLFLVAEQLQ
jgi:hypothetical protein